MHILRRRYDTKLVIRASRVRNVGEGSGEFNGMYTVSRKSVSWLQSYLKGEKHKTTSVRQNHKPNSSFHL